MRATYLLDERGTWAVVYKGFLVDRFESHDEIALQV